MVIRPVRKNGQTNERGVWIAWKHIAFVDIVKWKGISEVDVTSSISTTVLTSTFTTLSPSSSTIASSSFTTNAATHVEKKDNQMSTDSDSSPVYYSIMPNKGAHRLVRRQWASRWIYDGLCHTASVAMEPWLPSMAKEHCCRLLAGTHHAGGRKLSWPEWLATD